MVKTRTPKSPLARSRITNGRRVLPAHDGRSAPARRFNDLYQELVAQLGSNGGLDTITDAMAKQVAFLLAEQEQMVAARLSGGDFDLRDFLQNANALRRGLGQLNLIENDTNPDDAIDEDLAEYVRRRHDTPNPDKPKTKERARL